MKLSELSEIFPLKVIIDNEFFSLGIISHSMPKMLVFLESDIYLHKLISNENVSCVVTNDILYGRLPPTLGISITDNPRKTFFEIHEYLANHTSFYWKDFLSEISPEAVIHPSAYVSPKNVVIGKGSVIGPGVVINERSIIKEDVIIHSGTVIGAGGMEYQKIHGEVIKITHAGGVKLENRVEIHSNCVISSAVFGGFTQIGEDTKISNLVLVGHNTKIGNRCLIAGGSIIAGSVNIGDDVWIGPNATISDEIIIGDGAAISIGAVVTKNVAPMQRVSGNFAIDHAKFIKFINNFHNNRTF